MPSLLLEGENGDVLDLDYVQKHGRGIQVTAGVTGFGLPPIQTRWIEGAGNGATFRGRRVLPRDVDLLLTILGDDHADLQNLLNRLARLLEGKVRLRMLEDTGLEWWLDTHWVGGGDYAYGVNGQGETDADLLITLRAGDPFWTSETTQQKIISSRGTAALAASRSTPSTGVVPFLNNLGGLAVAPSQASGEITLENAGDAESHPIWEVRGPGENFEAVAPNGDVFRWVGVLGPDDVLTIDTATGLVTDQNGVNRYAELDEAPRLWTIPAGTNTGTASLSNTSTGTWVASETVLATNHCRNPFAGGGNNGTGFANWSSGTGETGGYLFTTNTGARVVVRTNLFLNPNPTTSATPGWSFQHGAGQTSTLSYVTDAGDGPTPEIANYLRRTVTAAATSGSSGWYYREPPGTAVAGAAGDVRRAAMWVRFSVPVSLASSVTFRMGSSGAGGANVPTVALPANTWHLVTGEATATGAYDGAQIFPGTATLLPAGATYDAAVAHFETPATWQGDVFWGASPTQDLPGDVRYSHAYEGAAGASASTRSIQITPGATLNGRGFARRVIVTPKTAGSTGWTARVAATRANVSGKAGDKVTVAVTQRFVGSGDGQGFRLRMEFQDAAGASIRNVDIPNTPLGTSGEIINFRNTVDAPVDFESIGWWLYQAGATNAASIPPAGSVVDCNGVLIATNLPDPATAPFDGGSSDGEAGFFEWSGAVSNSPSIKRASRLSGASRIAVSWRARKWLMV